MRKRWVHFSCSKKQIENWRETRKTRKRHTFIPIMLSETVCYINKMKGQLHILKLKEQTKLQNANVFRKFYKYSAVSEAIYTPIPSSVTHLGNRAHFITHVLAISVSSSLDLLSISCQLEENDQQIRNPPPCSIAGFTKQYILCWCVSCLCPFPQCQNGHQIFIIISDYKLKPLTP